MSLASGQKLAHYEILATGRRRQRLERAFERAVAEERIDIMY